MAESKVTFDAPFSQADIDLDNAIAVSDGGNVLSFKLEITPEDFLKFAELDITGEDTRALVNGLSNAKRAIDSQTEIVLRCLHIKPEVLKKRKLEILNHLGIVAPRIIRKIRNARNLLEHEYKCPTKEQVEDAIDVATLFITACSRTLYLFPELVHIANEDAESDSVYLFKKSVRVIADWNVGGFRVTAQIDGKHTDEELQVSNSEILYYDLLRLFVAAHLEKNEEQALDALKEYLITKTRANNSFNPIAR